MATTAVERKLPVGGQWIETGDWLEVRSPYSGELVGRVAKGGAVETRRIGRAPLVEQVVVVDLQAGESEVGVVHAEVEAVAGEAGEVGEAQLSPDAVDVHVGESRDRVVATGADLVEAGGARRGRVAGFVEPRQRAARPHGDVGELALPRPRLAAVDLDDARAVVAELRGHAIDPEVGRLDQVVVGRDQLGIGREHERLHGI